jgi:hypothetical protein
LIYSGVTQEQRAAAGVAIMINNKFKNRIYSYSFVNERIVTIRLRIERRYMIVIGVCAPQEGMKEETAEYYEILQEQTQKINKNDYLCVARDMNARVVTSQLIIQSVQMVRTS